MVLVVRAPPGRDQYVAGLHVPVHEPAEVRRVERPRDLRADLRDRPVEVEPGLVGEDRAQIPALDVAHRDEQHALDLARVVDRDDVRVLDRGGLGRFAGEPLAKRVVLGELGGQDLQRHIPVEAQVAGQVDHAHAAATDDAFDAVVAELRPALQI